MNVRDWNSGTNFFHRVVENVFFCKIFRESTLWVMLYRMLHNLATVKGQHALLSQCCSTITSRTSSEHASCKSIHVKITETEKIEFWRYLDIWNSVEMVNFSPVFAKKTPKIKIKPHYRCTRTPIPLIQSWGHRTPEFARSGVFFARPRTGVVDSSTLQIGDRG